MAGFKKYLKQIRNYLRHILIGHLTYEHIDIQKQIDEVKLILGRQESRNVSNVKLKSIQEAEFKIFSQFGEDGIIQYLISKVEIKNKIFVEIGVGDYAESNTRFLIMNNNWSGNIVDCENDHIKFLNSDEGKDLMYKHNIRAYSEFINKQNINSVLKKMNLPIDIGILSIDIDGVDYWIWEEIKIISPRIVIIEYNSNFGPDLAITVPYKADFERSKEHYSHIYFGSSLKALCILASNKGYRFVGSNSTGLNAFFVRKDLMNNLPNISVKQGYNENLFREAKDENGNLSYISSRIERLKLIESKYVYDIEKEKTVTIKNAFKL